MKSLILALAYQKYPDEFKEYTGGPFEDRDKTNLETVAKKVAGAKIPPNIRNATASQPALALVTRKHPSADLSTVNDLNPKAVIENVILKPTYLSWCFDAEKTSLHEQIWKLYQKDLTDVDTGMNVGFYLSYLVDPSLDPAPVAVYHMMRVKDRDNWVSFLLHERIPLFHWEYLMYCSQQLRFRLYLPPSRCPSAQELALGWQRA
jgi:hypothetical protein